MPVYNGESFLDVCINSLLSQSYKNFEVILIDDGSEDQSGQICDRWAEKDQKIRVIHKTNEGVTRARITGVEEATSEFISFVDVDDWVDVYFLERLVDSMTLTKADIVISGCFYEEEGKTTVSKNLIKAGTYEGKMLVDHVISRMLYYNGFYKFGIQPYMCNKLFRKDLLKACLKGMDTTIYDGEDVAVVYPYIIESQKVIVINDCMYHYRIHRGSVTHRIGDDFYENVSKLYLYLDKKFKGSKYYDLIRPQLDEYMRMMIWKGTPENIRGKTEQYFFPFAKVKQNSDIVLYGAGEVGKKYYQQIMRAKYCNIVSWVDKNYMELSAQGIPIEPLETALEKKFDYVVIANATEKTRNEIKFRLIGLGVEEEIIVSGEEE